MASDKRQWNSFRCLGLDLSWTKTFSLEKCLYRKFYRRNSINAIVLTIYLTILYLCLFVNGEALQNDDNQAVILRFKAKDYESKPSLRLGLDGRDITPHHLRIVKSIVPAQTARLNAEKQEQNQELRDSSLTNETAGGPPSAVLASVKESVGKLQSKVSLPVNVSVQELQKTDVKDTQLTENSTTKISSKLKDAEQLPANPEEGELGHGPSIGLKPEAVLRLFYVLVGVGVIVLIYILIKFLRFRRKRSSTRKYRVLAHSDEQEMFPLAADDGEDEEIFNAADHQSLK